MGVKAMGYGRNFWCLFFTQFFSALNDNFFKSALIIVAIYQNVAIFGLTGTSLSAMAGAVFILPFLLFSPYAGRVADDRRKSNITLFTKIFELVVMTAAAVAFMNRNYFALLVILFFMGFHSTIFGPIKYSVLPEILDNKQLLGANAWVEAGTFIAILIGNVAGGYVAGLTNALSVMSVTVVALAAIGLGFSLFFKSPPKQKSPDFKHNPFLGFGRILVIAKKYPLAPMFLFAISWFWMLGAVLLTLIPVLAKENFSGSESIVTLFLGLFTIGTGLGSFFCSQLLTKTGLRKMLLGTSTAMSAAFGFLAYFSSQWTTRFIVPAGVSEFLAAPEGPWIAAGFVLIAIFGGAFALPLYTELQIRVPEFDRSKVIASLNVWNSIFMVIAAVSILAMGLLGLSASQILVFFAVAQLVFAALMAPTWKKV